MAIQVSISMFAWDSKRTMRLILEDCPTIELSQFIKFLGGTLDNKLSFNKHNVDITKKAIPLPTQCKRAVTPSGGLLSAPRSKKCRWIYTIASAYGFELL